MDRVYIHGVFTSLWSLDNWQHFSIGGGLYDMDSIGGGANSWNEYDEMVTYHE
jgi:hypothetical protein